LITFRPDDPVIVVALVKPERIDYHQFIAAGDQRCRRNDRRE
jgi:hypothetical protein